MSLTFVALHWLPSGMQVGIFCADIRAIAVPRRPQRRKISHVSFSNFSMPSGADTASL